MWNVNPQLDDNYGPDYGVDYARFSDPPDFRKDFLLKKSIQEQLSQHEHYRVLTVTVRNGFIIMKGSVPDHKTRDDVLDFVRTIPGVVEVINQISVNENIQ